MTHTTESLMALAYDYSKSCMTFVEPKALAALHSAIAELVAERDALAKENERQKMHIKHIGNDALRTENHTLRAQLDALQSGDELPELPQKDAYVDGCDLEPVRSGFKDLFLVEKMQSYARQAQAMARAKMLAELGDVEAVAVVKNHNLQPVILRRELPDGTKLYTHPLPAQDVNAELVEALEMLCNGLEWSIENHPTVMNQSDEEALHSARTALANAKAAQQKEITS